MVLVVPGTNECVCSLEPDLGALLGWGPQLYHLGVSRAQHEWERRGGGHRAQVSRGVSMHVDGFIPQHGHMWNSTQRECGCGWGEGKNAQSR